VWDISARRRLIESLISIAGGAKLAEKPDDVGADSVQFIAQQSLAIEAFCELLLLLALSQQSIIPALS
jgi:hypothetical protein